VYVCSCVCVCVYGICAQWVVLSGSVAVSRQTTLYDLFGREDERTRERKERLLLEHFEMAGRSRRLKLEKKDAEEETGFGSHPLLYITPIVFFSSLVVRARSNGKAQLCFEDGWRDGSERRAVRRIIQPSTRAHFSAIRQESRCCLLLTPEYSIKRRRNRSKRRPTTTQGHYSSVSDSKFSPPLSLLPASE